MFYCPLHCLFLLLDIPYISLQWKRFFLPNPEDGEIILKEVQVWVLAKQDFHWNFLIIIITPACLTEKWQNWTTTDTLAGTTLTVYSNICHNYYRVMLSLPSTSSFWSLTSNTLGEKKNFTLYFINPFIAKCGQRQISIKISFSKIFRNK